MNTRQSKDEAKDGTAKPRRNGVDDDTGTPGKRAPQPGKGKASKAQLGDAQEAHRDPAHKAPSARSRG